jgi:flagellar biosynthesis protein FlhF
MRLKSFFADSVEEAIRLARQELGPDAMLVNSKRTVIEARHLGVYEVVVCGEGPETSPIDAGTKKDGARDVSAPLRASSLPGASSSPSVSVPVWVSPPPVDKLSQDVSELKQRMEKLALTLARSGGGMASAAFDSDLARVFTALTDAELETDLAYDVVGKLTSPEATVRAELAKLVRVDSELGVRGTRPRAVALVGPPGAGKTSALVKLAVQYGVAAGKTVQILTTDTYRIAAAEELRSYAAILGVGCQVLESPSALAQVLGDSRHLAEPRPKDLILIDTPGLCYAEMEACDDLARLLATHPAIDTHLVLPASMRTADLRRVAEQYGIFQPHKLLFTRMDETQTYGPLLSLSVQMGKPISFFSHGQRIPEDLEPATAGRLLDLILRAFAGPPALHASENAAPKFDVVAA